MSNNNNNNDDEVNGAPAASGGSNNNSRPKIIFVCNDSKRWVEPFVNAVKAKGHIVEMVDVNALPRKQLTKGDLLVNFLNPSTTYLNDAKTLQECGEKGFVIVNGSPEALYLDGGKCRQYEELTKHGIDVPKTFQVDKAANLAEKASRVYQALGRNTAVVLKPNLGTEGKNVSLHATSNEALQTILKKGSTMSISPGDGIVLIQENVRAPTDKFVYRAEFIDGKLLYVARIDATTGQSLCPCQLSKGNNKKTQISILLDNEIPVSASDMSKFKEKCVNLIKANDVDACSFEFAVKDNTIYVYDLNILSTFNVDAERAAANKRVPRGHEEYCKMIESYLL